MKDGRIHLTYVLGILVSMFYGGTSSNGLGAYMVSFQEACRALKENGVRHPYWISMKRTCRILKRFIRENDIENAKNETHNCQEN